VPPVHEPLEGVDRLAFLYRISGAFNSSLDLDQVLNTVMDEVIVATHAERGFLVLREPDGRLVFRAARGLDQHAVAIEKGRMERELQMAREVQASLFPRQTPQLPGREFAVFWQPARQVADDFDFLPGGRLGLVIADVSDKGMPGMLNSSQTAMLSWRAVPVVWASSIGKVRVT
jgi:GAF domain-containing protein